MSLLLMVNYSTDHGNSARINLYLFKCIQRVIVRTHTLETPPPVINVYCSVALVLGRNITTYLIFIAMPCRVCLMTPTSIVCRVTIRLVIILPWHFAAYHSDQVLIMVSGG